MYAVKRLHIVSFLLLLVHLVLSSPIETLCRSKLPQPTVPNVFSVSIQSENSSSFLGVVIKDTEDSPEGPYLPLQSVPFPQPWTLLENGTLSTNTSYGSQVFVWEIPGFADYNSTLTTLVVESWVDEPNHQLASVKASPVCGNQGLQTMLTFGDHIGKWIFSPNIEI